MTALNPFRLVIIEPDLSSANAADDAARSKSERSRQLRIGLLENGCDIAAVIPTDTFLGERLAQLQPDMIIVDTESEARD